jgi:hypothetical protein
MYAQNPIRAKDGLSKNDILGASGTSAGIYDTQNELNRIP